MQKWVKSHWVKGMTGLFLLGCLGAGGVIARNLLEGDCCKVGAACCKPGAACCHHGRDSQASH